MFRRQFRTVAAGLACVYLVSCGTGSNINGLLFVSKKQNESIDVLISQAEMAYDSGDFETAKDKAEQAFEINTQNEKVAVLLGYIYLSYAGIDPFQLAKSLISGSSKTTATTTTTETTSSSSSSSAAGQLGILSSIVNVDETSLALLGEKSSEPAAFAQYPVIHPALASVAREAGVQSLAYAAKAIKTICPFVGDDVLISDDPRHKRVEGGSCEKTGLTIKYASKSNFLWAFAHLADALVFYNVLMYTNPDASTPNIEARAKLVGTKTTDITSYIQMVSALAKDISAIFQTEETDSQINAVLNSLTAAAKAFEQIGSGASTFTAGIEKALTSLKSAGSTSTSASQSKALQSQLTAGVSKQLSSKLDDLKASDPTKYAENKTEICALFETIAAGDAESKPTDCK